MSFVTELAATMLASPLSQNKGKGASTTSNRVPSRVAEVEGSAVRVDSTLQRIIEKQTGTVRTSDAKAAPELPTNFVRGGKRYSLFVDAVQALRLDKATAAELSPGRVAQLKAAAKEVFQFTGEIPRDQRPSEMPGEKPAPVIEETQVATGRAVNEAGSDVRRAQTDSESRLGATPGQADPAEATSGDPTATAAGTTTPEPIPEPVISTTGSGAAKVENSAAGSYATEPTAGQPSGDEVPSPTTATEPVTLEPVE